MTLVIPETNGICPVCEGSHITLLVRRVYEIGVSADVDRTTDDTDDSPYAQWIRSTTAHSRWVLAEKLEYIARVEPPMPMNPATWPIVICAALFIISLLWAVGSLFSSYLAAVLPVYSTLVSIFGIPLALCAGYLHGSYRLTRQRWEKQRDEIRKHNWITHRIWEQNLYVCPFADNGEGHVFIAGKDVPAEVQPVQPQYHASLIEQWLSIQTHGGITS